jgi:hypothetical protein
MNSHSLFKHNKGTDEGLKEVQKRRVRDPEFLKAMKVIHSPGTSSTGSQSDDSSVGLFDLDEFREFYSESLQKVIEKFESQGDTFFKSFDFKETYFLCKKLQEVGPPIYIDTFFKKKHVSFQEAQRLTSEIEGLLGLIESKHKHSPDAQTEADKLHKISYILCKCTEDRHETPCTRPAGGKRRKTKKTKKRRSSKKRRPTRRR